MRPQLVYLSLNVLLQKNPMFQTLDSCEYIWAAGVGFSSTPATAPQYDVNRFVAFKQNQHHHHHQIAPPYDYFINTEYLLVTSKFGIYVTKADPENIMKNIFSNSYVPTNDFD